MMSDDVSTYMNPSSKTTNKNSSSMMDSLLCRVQNDRDLIQPFVVREMQSTAIDNSSNNNNNIVVSPSSSKDDTNNDGDESGEVVL